MKCYLLPLAFSIVCLISCSENTLKYESITFEQLEIPIQDTLIKLSNNVQILWQEGKDSLFNQHQLEILDFTGRYKIVRKELGPWIIAKILVDTINHKSYRFTHNPPTPFIITEQYIAFPQEYNTLTLGFKKGSVFKRKKLRQ